PQTSKAYEEKPKKRIPNMFISYRNEMMKYKPNNIQMTKYSQLMSEKWKELSEIDKTELQRQYQINRDEKLSKRVEYETVANQNGILPDGKTILERNVPIDRNQTNYKNL
ncbi:14603_t:CDS:1, partial [Funneliformis mosseae]